MITLRVRLDERQREVIDAADAKVSAQIPNAKGPGARLALLALHEVGSLKTEIEIPRGGKIEPWFVRIDPEHFTVLWLAILDARLKYGLNSDAEALTALCASYLGSPVGVDAPNGAGRLSTDAQAPTGERAMQPSKETKGTSHPSVYPSSIPLSTYARHRGGSSSRSSASGLGLGPGESATPGSQRARVEPHECGADAYSAPPSAIGFATFEHITGLYANWLPVLARRADSLYRPGFVPKRDGTLREIAKPEPMLKAALRHINDTLLAPAIDSPIGFGHSRERDHLAACRVHARRRPECLATADIWKFFDSVTVEHVAAVLRTRLGFAPDLAEVVAQLLTRNERLPQGSPASPAIASLLLAEADQLVAKRARVLDLVVIRYVDDYAISGNDRAAIEELVAFIARELEAIGLALNPKKTRIMPRTGPQIMLGLSVGHGKISLPQEARQALDRETHAAEKLGADPKTMARLRRRVEYVSRFQPKLAEKFAARLDRAKLKENKMPTRHLRLLPRPRVTDADLEAALAPFLQARKFTFEWPSELVRDCFTDPLEPDPEDG